MPDGLYFLFGGIVYLISERFREMKRREWEAQSELYKIYEVGMWVAVPTIMVAAIVIALVK